MGLISIGALTVTRNPTEMTPVEDIRYNSHVLTYTGVTHFSWGVDIVGKEIDVVWELMEYGEYSTLKSIYDNDAAVVFDPNDGSGSTYNVELTNLNSVYYMGRRTGGRRRNIRLTMLILSEV